MALLLLFSFLAGIATILSPCIIPILPAVLSGGIHSGKYRPIGIVLGLISSFTFFTLTLTTLVRATGVSPDILRYIAIVAVGLFGLIMLFPVLGDFFARLTSFSSALGTSLQKHQGFEKSEGFWGGILLGISLGLLWTPCAGPILASVTTLALTGNVTTTAVLLTIAYSIGAGVPLLAIAYGGNRTLTSSRFFASQAETIRRFFGIIMIVTALAMLLNIDRELQLIALRYFPNFQPDASLRIQRELDKVKSPNTQLAQQIQGRPLNSIEMVKDAGNVLPNLGPAPELTGIESWINASPLTLASLKGKVVLIDFWTYTCINCIRTLPHVTRWYNQYKDDGFVVIGVHTPEFEFEKKRDNVLQATKRYSISYPVALDNMYGTWNAYQNRYWPAHYLIDKEGIIRRVHFGEGDYVETENAIRSLLGLDPLLSQEESNRRLPLTPEIYLGYLRAEHYTDSMESLSRDITKKYSFSPPLATNQVGLSGTWNVQAERIVSQDNESKLRLQFTAGKVHLVISGKSAIPLQVFLNDKQIPKEYQSADYSDNGTILIEEEREYTLVDLHDMYGSHEVELTVPKGVSLYAFTFGQ